MKFIMTLLPKKFRKKQEKSARLAEKQPGNTQVNPIDVDSKVVEISNRAYAFSRKANEEELALTFLDASRSYFEAAKVFSEALSSFPEQYSKCISASYLSLIYHHYQGRAIEVKLATSADYEKRFINDIKNSQLSRLQKCQCKIQFYLELKSFFEQKLNREKVTEIRKTLARLNIIEDWHKAFNMEPGLNDKKESFPIKALLKTKALLINVCNFFINIFRVFFDSLYYLSCGLFFKPLNVFSLSLLAILFFSAIYKWGNLIEKNCDPSAPVNLYHCIYYSVITFTTLGYGDYLPKEGWGQAVATCEVILGYLMLGILVSILSKKISP